MEFTAIDFETATSKYTSACSIGLAHVKEGRIQEEYYSLLRPPSLEFNPYNSRVHGIFAHDVRDAPTFGEIWPDIAHFFTGSNPLIAHNANFDMLVLKACLEYYHIELPAFHFLCSMNICSTVFKRHNQLSLKALADECGYAFEHHNALADAKACAKVVACLLENYQLPSLQELRQNHPNVSLCDFQSLQMPLPKPKRAQRSALRKTYENVKISDLTPRVSSFDPDHPFYAKNVAFTGDLKKMSRKQAMQAVLDAGGAPKSQVNGNTHYLVVGQNSLELVRSGKKSAKELTAKAWIEKGRPLQLLCEEQFYSLLNPK